MKSIIKRVVALVMALAVCLSFTNVTSIKKINIVNAEKSDKDDLKDAIEINNSQNDVDKRETVYIKADPEGNIQNITVSDWLKNPENKDTLKDASDLKDITNVKGKEEFSGSGDTMEWKADGNDIYYQGTTDKELPVSVNISYKLNGENVSADEIAGKSGDVEIKFTYTNKEKKTVTLGNNDYTVNVPFTVISGMILNGDNFENVEIDNGKVVSDGDKNIVVGLAMPGLTESLKLDEHESTKDVNIPESVTVKAKATDFKLDLTMTVITSNLLEGVNIKDVNSIDEIKDDLNELNSASDKLVNGSTDLAEGVDKLKSSFSEYSDGIDTLVNGLNSAGDGTEKLYTGASSLEKGAKQLDTGVDTLKKGAKSFKDGTNQLDTGAESIKTGAKSLNSGAEGLSSGLDQFKKTFDDGVDKSKKDTEEYLNTKTAKEISDVVTGAVNTAATAAAQTASGSIATSIADSVGKSGATIGASIRATASDKEQAQKLATQLVSAGVITKEEVPTLSKLLSSEAFTNMLGNQVAQGVSSNIKKSASDSSSEQAKQLQQAIAANVKTALGDEASNGVKTSLTNLGKFLNEQTDASKAQVDATLSISDGYKTSGKATTLKDGADALAKGTTKLSSGADEFRAGVSKLNSGADSIYEGAGKLKTGTSKLATGSGKLRKGILTLKNGSKKLVVGGKKLNNATGLISDGIDELDNGANKLNDGMIEFDNKGIDVIYNTIDTDLKQLIDRIQAVKKAAEEYQTFTKLHKGAKGEVKFVVETTAIKADDSKDE